MTRVVPLLPTDLTKASTYDLLTFLNTRLAEQAEENDYGYDEILSDITTELLSRHDRPSGQGKPD
jgi:hypothetical protein